MQIQSQWGYLLNKITSSTHDKYGRDDVCRVCDSDTDVLSLSRDLLGVSSKGWGDRKAGNIAGKSGKRPPVDDNDVV